MNSSGSKPWYVRSFGELYPLVYRQRDDASAHNEIKALFRFLDVTGDGPVLDLCCGAGRHAAVVGGLGFRVFGIDLSPQLLRLAAERPGLVGRLARADMRRIPFADGSFGFVLNLFTSFGYFENDADNEAVLHDAARVLRPGGVLVIDHVNRTTLEKEIVPKSEEKRDGFLIRQQRRIEGNRIFKKIDVTDPDGQAFSFTESVRLYGPDEIAALCRKAGLEKRKILGSFHGEEFGPSSERMIVVVEKPGGERNE